MKPASQTITHNEKVLLVEMLPKEIQDKIYIYEKWTDDLNQLQLELLKTQSAVDAITQDLSKSLDELSVSKPQDTQ